MFLTHEGELPLAQAAVALDEVKAMLTAKGWTGLVVDVTSLRSAPNAEEMLTLGHTLPRHLPRRTRVALVVRLDQARHARLIEQIARKGGTFLTFFTDIEKAEKWMRGKPPDNVTQRALRDCSPMTDRLNPSNSGAPSETLYRKQLRQKDLCDFYETARTTTTTLSQRAFRRAHRAVATAFPTLPPAFSV